MEQRWIPVSERLPEKPKENEIFDNKPLELYLVSIKGDPYPLSVLEWEVFYKRLAKV